MLNRYIEARISSAERRMRGRLDYLRYMLRSSRGAFIVFSKAFPMARFRCAVPPDPYHVVAIVATMHEGCSGCLTVEMNAAESAGVAADVVRATLDRRPEALDADCSEAYRFAVAVLADDDCQDEARARVVQRYGDAGLVELSMRIAISRMFAQMTRALGFASDCPVRTDD